MASKIASWNQTVTSATAGTVLGQVGILTIQQDPLSDWDVRIIDTDTDAQVAVAGGQALFGGQVSLNIFADTDTLPVMPSRTLNLQFIVQAQFFGTVWSTLNWSITLPGGGGGGGGPPPGSLNIAAALGGLVVASIVVASAVGHRSNTNRPRSARRASVPASEEE